MLRIFIGYDERERIAYHVLAHSILRRSSIPVSIAPLVRPAIKCVFDRQRGEYDSTDFSISRFIVPYLCDFGGWAVFMDCDMLCLGDVAELAGFATLMDKYGSAVRVVKHQYTPADRSRKFLGEPQTAYERKNWSSVILFNNHLCRSLTPQYVGNAYGLDLHQFKWTDEWKLGELPHEWNYLVGEDNQTRKPPKLVHFTRGGPWFQGYESCEYAEHWRRELHDMTSTT